MTSIDWLWILHPALIVILAYPLLGMALLQARRTRLRRLGQRRLPASSGTDHASLGATLAAVVVAVCLVALGVVITTHGPLAQFSGGVGRLAALALVGLGTAGALAALLRSRGGAARAVFALLTWIGLLGLGSQPEVWRLSDNPLSATFWQSHYWGGAGLTGLLLFAVASRPEIQRQPRWRRWHVGASVLAGALFLAQAITGSRDLLEIPLSWQKPTIQACDHANRTCPPPAPRPASPAPAATPPS